MSATPLVPQPFLDWFGIWPGQAGRDEKGRAWLQDPPQGIALKVQPARMSAVFMRPDPPWEQNSLSHMMVLHEEGRLRLWYDQRTSAEESGAFNRYAESADGFNWDFPELGLYEYQGSTANNIIQDHRTFDIHSLFRDPAAPPQARYKAIEARGQLYRHGRPVPNQRQTKLEIREVRRAMELNGYTPEQIDAEADIRHILRGAASPDGLRWTVLEEPLYDAGHTQLDTQNIAAYDEDSGEYVAYLRGNLERRRSVRRTGGAEFGKWHPTRLVLTVDAHDAPDEDIYTPCYCRCPGSRRHLMFPTIYHRLSSTLDIQFASSRDGWLWHRPERRPLIGRHIHGEEYGALYASPNLVPVGDDWGLPVLCYLQRHDGGGAFLSTADKPMSEYRWALWQPDRLVALEVPIEGRFSTVERLCQGVELRLNFRTQQGGWVKVGLAHRPTTPASPLEEIEGFGVEDCDVLEGDHIARTVTWNGRSDLSALEGRNLSLRFQVARAQLFSTAL